MEDVKSDLVSYREVLPGDLNFIFSTWLKGLRHGNEYFGKIDADAYFEHYHKKLESILFSETTVILVACLKEDADVILGYSVFSHDVLHWVFVKKAWRKIGIAKKLVPLFSAYTHSTNVSEAIIRKKFPNAVNNPYLTP